MCSIINSSISIMNSSSSSSSSISCHRADSSTTTASALAETLATFPLSSFRASKVLYICLLCYYLVLGLFIDI